MIRYFGQIQGQFTEVDQLQEGSWIHIAPPIVQEELEDLSQLLGVTIDTITDPLDPEERARYEKYDDVKSIILHNPVLNDSLKENDPIFITIPLGIILTKGYVITISSLENPVIERFLSQKVKNFSLSDERLFVLQIFEQTTFLFLDYLKKLNLRRSLIEQELYNSSRTEELKSLLRIEKSLVYFVNSLSANELLSIKMKRTDFLGLKDNEDFMDLFEDTLIDNNQAREVAQLYTNILSGTIEAYTSIVSNNLNSFVNRLTVITVLLMVPTFIASLFGMNVKLPFNLSNNGFAFYIVVIFAFGLSLTLAWIFKRKQIF